MKKNNNSIKEKGESLIFDLSCFKILIIVNIYFGCTATCFLAMIVAPRVPTICGSSGRLAFLGASFSLNFSQTPMFFIIKQSMPNSIIKKRSIDI
jgi:hypothetical protein